ncbi:MAG: glutamyl-tRNA reductase [Proteobacteria bacterium]|nr:glutamyl-tRNA reductase [Pseudomonadota bacterium]
MPFRILGINHKTAPVAIREQVAFDPQHLTEALRSLTRESGIAEAVILSTCNRTEVYWSGSADAETLSRWLSQSRRSEYDLTASLYLHEEQAAVEHVFRVAAGLDSMMLGEAQILGQLKDAYRAAQQAGSAGPMLHKLFQASFSTAKRVRTETRIGANAVSIASACIALARRVFANLGAHAALLIGAGEMITLAARHMAAQGVGQLIIANRTLPRAQELAVEVHGMAVPLTDMAGHLPQSDIVVSCTASPTPIISKDMVRMALRARRHKPMFMVDLAVPRDIEPDVAELEDVYLFTIDDLQQVVAENRQQRASEADAAQTLIAEEVARFIADTRTKDAGPAIRALRAQSDAVRVQTVEQARRMLANGRPAEEALEFLANTLTNRLLHAPTQALRDAAELGDAQVAQVLTRLLVRDGGD